MIGSGTICIWQNMPVILGIDLNGTECTAMSGLKFKDTFDVVNGRMRSGLVYETDTMSRDGRHINALPHQLREKNPPKGEFTDEEEKENEQTNI